MNQNSPLKSGNREQGTRVDFPEPSLWNSQFGRRTFLKKTGAATAATAIALHGFRMEVLASDSAKKYEISAQGGTSTGSNDSSTPVQENGVDVQWTRTTTVTFSPPGNLNPNQIAWGTTATSTITATVTAQKFQKVNGDWVAVGGPITCTHSRTKKATIDADTGVFTVSQNDDEDVDSVTNGLTVTINPTATPSISVAGPAGVPIGNGTAPASPGFVTRQVQ